jgi:hypothetical protein
MGCWEAEARAFDRRRAAWMSLDERLDEGAELARIGERLGCVGSSTAFTVSVRGDADTPAVHRAAPDRAQ